MSMAIPKPNHKRRVPKRSKRTEFSKQTRERIKERDNGECQQCGAPGTQIHHVKPRGSGQGKGVYTNGLLLCTRCHQHCHDNPEILAAWQDTFESRYGPDYFCDDYE